MGGLSWASAFSSLEASNPNSISDSDILLGLCPNSSTTNSAVSASIDWLAVAAISFFIRTFITSATLEAFYWPVPEQ